MWPLLLCRCVAGRHSERCDSRVRPFQLEGSTENGSASDTDLPGCSTDVLREKVKRKDVQLLEMNKENEMLKIKVWLLGEVAHFVFRASVVRAWL